MTTFFTSDLHLGHKNIIKYCARPWASVAEMDEALIENWNAVVEPGDEVWDLGDVAFCAKPARVFELLRRLNGRHHLILGNHDAPWIRDSADFASFHDGLHEITVEGQPIVLCHYALREWRNDLRGAWHLFGHTHGLLRPFGKSVDVGVDNTWEVLRGAALTVEEARTTPCLSELYRPVSFAEVKAFLDARPVGPHAALGGEGKTE
jgi:calcineurin-like phosphoesterase family protein